MNTERLTKIFKVLNLNEKEIEIFTIYHETLMQAAPRLCENQLLLVTVMSDIYHDAEQVTDDIQDGILHRKYRLTTKHIAHAASIERTLMSMEREGGQ